MRRDPFSRPMTACGNFSSLNYKSVYQSSTAGRRCPTGCRPALLELLPSGDASTQAVSKKLGLSTRTLQRRLSTEGGSFQLVLKETREELARHYLKSSTMSGAEISFLLGFEDPNSFFRAFHTWTGETPEGVRTVMRAGN